jgi:hypothetical protein
MAFLIDNVDDLRLAGVPVGKNFSLPPFLPYVDSVWQELFPQFIGRALTEQLEAAWSPDTLTTAQIALRPYLVRPLCQLAFERYLPFAEVTIADDGINVSADSTRKPATERQIIAIRKALYELGWKHLENLLSYLDYHKADFSAYTDFVATQERSLLPTATDFSKFYQILGSRVTYQALKPTLDQLEQDTLVPKLGNRWPSILDSTDVADKSLLRQLRVWLAKKTILEAAPSLAIELTGNALKVHFSANTDNIEYYTPPSDTQFDRLINKLEQQTEIAWQLALQLLDDAPGEPGRGLFDNEGAKIVFF